MMLNNSKYEGKITSLASNQAYSEWLGKQEIGARDGEPVYSNCSGTVIHTIGAHEEFLDFYRDDIERLDDKRLIIINRFGEYCLIYDCDERPGYVSARHFRRFIRERGTPVRVMDKDIIFTEGDASGVADIHSGIVLNPESSLIFHQNGLGGKFRRERWNFDNGGRTISPFDFYRYSPRAKKDARRFSDIPIEERYIW